LKYADGFVVPIPTKNIAAYKRLARQSCKIWLQYGALEYFECVGEDMNIPMGIPFPRLAKIKRGETVVFAWIVYKSRKHRDAVNAKVMKDPRILNMMQGKKMPFDMKRITYGGFKVLVEG